MASAWQFCLDSSSSETAARPQCGILLTKSYRQLVLVKLSSLNIFMRRVALR